MASVHKYIALSLLVALIVASVEGDKGCPRNPGECVQHCKAQGKPGKCEKRWYRWKYRSRCKCNPCQGNLILGACVGTIRVGVSCDGNGQNCKPTG